MATKVQVSAFELQFAKGVNFSDFIDELKNFVGTPRKIGNLTHHLLTDTLDGFLVGLVISYKGDKKFLTTKEGLGDLEVSTIKLDQNQHSTVVSIFAINGSTRRGMYYQYHGGVSTGAFAKLLGGVHDSARKAKVKMKRSELTNAGTKQVEKATKKAEEHYEGRFVFISLMHNKDIDTLLEGYSELSRVEIRCSYALDDAPMFKPFADKGKGLTVGCTFEDKRNVAEIARSIRQVYDNITKKEEVKALRLYGKGIEGQALSEQLGQSMQYFDELSLDRYLELLPQDYWKNFKSSDAMVNLIKTMKKYVGVIGSP